MLACLATIPFISTRLIAKQGNYGSRQNPMQVMKKLFICHKLFQLTEKPLLACIGKRQTISLEMNLQSMK